MEFIICDDEEHFRKKVVKIINKIFINCKEDYYIKEYSKFDKEFAKTINNTVPKIYILDIEIENSISGLDIARKIRNKDWESIIILVSSHQEFIYQALKAQIMVLDFISKYDDCEVSLTNVLKLSSDLVNKKKVMKVESNYVSYIISYKDILYIERDTIERKCYIKTINARIPVNKSLTDIEKDLSDNFYLSHRSCIVNIDNILSVDWKNNIIKFVNGESTDLLSRDRKKGLKEYVNS